MNSQPAINFETVLNMVKQLSWADQLRLMEWMVGQVKERFARLSTLPDETAQQSYLTGRELAQSEIVGLWTERDIKDSVVYARQLRRQAQERTF